MDTVSHFHPFAMAMVQSESTENTLWILNIINDMLLFINEPALTMDYVMIYGSKLGLIRGCKEFFDDGLVVIHFLRALQVDGGTAFSKSFKGSEN